jgi:uncharacterized hydrophobic protein (TIGR00271 family)
MQMLGQEGRQRSRRLLPQHRPHAGDDPEVELAALRGRERFGGSGNCDFGVLTGATLPPGFVHSTVAMDTYLSDQSVTKPVGQTVAMLHLRITAPSELTTEVVRVLKSDPAVSSLAVVPTASIRPPGDLILADVAREAANAVIDQLRAAGVPNDGSVHIEPVRTWMSRTGFEAERRTPGSSADSVVWADVTQRAYEESELNWTYLSFMTLATFIASIAIVLDSQILVIGAMVLGPEFIAVAALGLAMVRRRFALLAIAARTLAVGFVVAIVLTALAALAARGLGWITEEDVTGPRPGTQFIYTPDKWSFIVAVVAAAAGVLSLTSAKVGGLSGVFISVTTVPAAGNVALGIAFGVGHEIGGSTLQLLLNLTGMAVAGWATLAFQQAMWGRMSARRARVVERLRKSPRSPLT